MEFKDTLPFAISKETLQQLSINQLPSLSDAIDTVLSDEGKHGEIYCIWGQFLVNRETIGDGVRFTLPFCPNALAWTITPHPGMDANTLVHVTINRDKVDDDFAESLEFFANSWQGLQTLT